MCVVGSVWLPLANIKSAPSQRTSKEAKTAGCVRIVRMQMVCPDLRAFFALFCLYFDILNDRCIPVFLTRKYQLRKDTKRVGMERKTKRSEALKMQEIAPLHSAWSLSPVLSLARLISIANGSSSLPCPFSQMLRVEKNFKRMKVEISRDDSSNDGYFRVGKWVCLLYVLFELRVPLTVPPLWIPLRISSFDFQSSTTSSHVPLLQNNAPRRTAPIELNAIRWRFCTEDMALTMMNPARQKSHIVHAAVVLAIALHKQRNCRSSVVVNSRGIGWMSRENFAPSCLKTMRQARGRRYNWLLAWRGAHLRRMRPSRRRMNRLPMGKVKRRLTRMTYRHLN